MAMASFQAGLHVPYSAAIPLDHSLSRTSTLPASNTTAPKDRSKRHSHHGIHSGHRHHHHRRKSHDENDDKVPQSAFVTSNPFEGLLHPSHHSSKSSQRLLEDAPPLSRWEREREAVRKTVRESRDAEVRKAQWQDVERLKRERRENEESLQTSLNHLSTLGTTTTRHLDYAYYNLLSSVPLLHASLSELQSLSQQTSQLKTHLLSQIPTLEAQTQAQLAALTSSYGALKDDVGDGEDASAQRRIEALEERMRIAKERVEDLGGRVEGVRKSIEDFESREREGRERSGWWMRICWVCLSVGVGFWLLVLGLGVRYHGGLGKGLQVSVGEGVGMEALAGIGAELGEAMKGWNSSAEVEGREGPKREEPRNNGNEVRKDEEEPVWERILDEL